jgi:RHS repeat-associated protein
LPELINDGTVQTLRAGGRVLGESDTEYRELLTDRLGSVRTVTDASGVPIEQRSYLAYGEPVSTASSSHSGYLGQASDGTSLLYLRARVYDPSTGAFLSSEPLNGGPRGMNVPTPRMQNTPGAGCSSGGLRSPYGYASANPISNVDLTGLATEPNPFVLDCYERCEDFEYEITSEWWWECLGDCDEVWQGFAAATVVTLGYIFWVTRGYQLAHFVLA